jgi:hypothetical protein
MRKNTINQLFQNRHRFMEETLVDDDCDISTPGSSPFVVARGSSEI